MGPAGTDIFFLIFGHFKRVTIVFIFCDHVRIFIWPLKYHFWIIFYIKNDL